MSISFRGRLFFIFMAVVLAALLTSGVFLEKELRTRHNAQIDSELLSKAGAVQEMLRMSGPPLTIEAMDSLADRAGEALSARITILLDDNTLLGDSHLVLNHLKKMGNQGSRPEIVQARREGQGQARRYSTIMGISMVYVALPFRNAAGGHGFIRVSMPLPEAKQGMKRVRRIMLYAALLGLAAALFASFIAAQSLSAQLRKLQGKAGTLIGPRGGRKIPVESADEFGAIAGSIDKIASKLAKSMNSLAEERDRFEAVLESIDDGVLALDQNHCVTHLNQSARTLLNIQNDVSGRSLLELIRVPELGDLIFGEAQDMAAPVEFDLHGEPPRRIQVTVAAPRITRGTVVVLRNITALRHLEAVRRDFVANVSHELRTPVSIICANAETLLNGALTDAGRSREFLIAIQRNAERLSNIIADLLDLSMIESGRYSLPPEPVSLNMIIQNMMSLLNERAVVKHLSIEINVDIELRILSDKRALEQIVFNLADNVIRHTPMGGNMVISAFKEEGLVHLEVQDNGPGIEEKHRERIFERFYRVDEGRSREMGGTGLGLSIVKHLVEVMNGMVSYNAALPHGSVFRVSLPSAE